MKCCVEGCNNNEKMNKYRDHKLTFHRFPKNPDIRAAWFANLNICEQDWNFYRLVCSDHFKKKDIYDISRRIKGGAIPIPVQTELNEPAMMRACKVCLSVDRKLYHLGKEKMDEIFQILTGIPVSDQRLPQCVCWECAARLTAAASFRSKALNSNRLLEDVLGKEDYIKVSDVVLINLKHEYIKSPLAIQKLNNELEHIPNCMKDEVDSSENQQLELKDVYCTEIQFKEENVNVAELINDDYQRPSEVKTEVDLVPAVEVGIDLTEDDIEPPTKEGITQTDDYFEPSSEAGLFNAESGIISGSEVRINNSQVDLAPSRIRMFNDARLMHLANGGIETIEMGVPGNDVTATDVINDLDDDEDDVNFAENDVITVEESNEESNTEDEHDSISVNLEKNENFVTKIDNNKASEVQNRKIRTLKRKTVKINKETPKIEKKVSKIKVAKKVDKNIFTVIPLTQEQVMNEVEKRKTSFRYMNSLYKCEVCFTGFPTFDKCMRHSLKHSEKNGQFECDICKIRVKHRYAINAHMQRTHTHEYRCKQCLFITRHRSAANMHVKYHAGHKYECKQCPSVFEKSTTYLNHLRLKHISDCVCEFCGYTFVSKTGVAAHKSRKHRHIDLVMEMDGPFCEVCDIKFASKKAYDRHLSLSSKHITNENDPNRSSNDPSIKSRQIGKRLQAMRRTRIRRRPSNEVPSKPNVPVTCEQCGLVLENLRQYASHFRSAHPGLNRTKYAAANCPYMCEQCGKMFLNKTLLSNHMWIHTGQKMYQCDYCKKKFCIKGNLAGHIRTHEGKRRTYECNVCGKQFAFSYNRNRHMFRHTGLKPYKCDACDKSFPTSGELRSHVDYVHHMKPRPKRIRRRRNKKCDIITFNMEY